MPENTDQIREGMDVYSLDGEKLGDVEKVRTPIETEGIESMTPDAGELGGTGTPTAEVEAERVLEEVEARGTNAGDIGAGSTGVPGFDDQSGTEPPRGPAEISPVGLGIQGYLEIRGSGGLLGIGAKTLYVPFSAVRDVTNDCVTLEVDKSQANQLYSSKPAFLN